MENIQVAARIRPLLERELIQGEASVLKSAGNTINLENTFIKATNKFLNKTFVYDDVFSHRDSNREVYKRRVSRVVLKCLEGYNGTIFMYGQTGSGKTYTMLGYRNESGLYNQLQSHKDKSFQLNESSSKLGIENIHEKYADLMYDFPVSSLDDNDGILIQALKDIFQKIEEDDEKTFFLKCSYFEIYNDQIFDLLRPRNKIRKSLNLYEDAKKGKFLIKGLTEESVSSVKEIFGKLKKGEINRHYAQTEMNHSSSRSHTLFRMTIKAVTNEHIRTYRQHRINNKNVNVKELLKHENKHQDGTIVTQSYLNFVDLAGSEKVSNHVLNKSNIEDEEVQLKIRNNALERVKEGKSINQSLFFLTRVISLKAQGKRNSHIPFRNSPLTKILRSSLGGNFRTLVILCVTPSSSQLEHSLSTLRFGMNAKKIKNKIKANIVTNNNSESIRILIENYEKKLRDLEVSRMESSSVLEQYISIINELEEQRNVLVLRLEEANKKLSLKMASSIPEETLNNFFRQASKRMLHLKRSGVLHIPEKNNKYDSLAKDSSLKNDFLTIFNERNPKEIVSRVALNAYKKVKAQQKKLKETVKKQNDYLKSVFGTFHSVCKFVTTMTDLGKTYLKKLELLIEQYQDEFVLSNERLIKLNFYEKFKGMSLLSDQDLLKMQNYVEDFSEAIQSEKDRRELLNRGKEKDNQLPRDLINSLRSTEPKERKDQEKNFEIFKDKIKQFNAFKEGCRSEVEYYENIYQEFQHKVNLGSKYKELKDYINFDLKETMENVKKMDETFRKFDEKLEFSSKKILEKKLVEYQDKFEKLVGEVLETQNLGSSNYIDIESENKSDKNFNDNKNSFPRSFSMKILTNENVTRTNSFKAFKNIRHKGKNMKKWLDVHSIQKKTLNLQKVLENSKPQQVKSHINIHKKSHFELRSRLFPDGSVLSSETVSLLKFDQNLLKEFDKNLDGNMNKVMFKKVKQKMIHRVSRTKESDKSISPLKLKITQSNQINDRKFSDIGSKKYCKTEEEGFERQARFSDQISNKIKIENDPNFFKKFKNRKKDLFPKPRRKHILNSGKKEKSIGHRIQKKSSKISSQEKKYMTIDKQKRGSYTHKSSFKTRNGEYGGSFNIRQRYSTNSDIGPKRNHQSYGKRKKSSSLVKKNDVWRKKSFYSGIFGGIKKPPFF